MSGGVSKAQTHQFRRKLPEALGAAGHSRSSRKQHPVKEDLARGSEGNGNQHQLKPARLTRDNLALLNKMARKEGAKKASTSSALESRGDLSIPRTTSTTTSGFAIQAYENGILDSGSSKPPINIKDLQKRYAQPRESASPAESAYEAYLDTVSEAINDATMTFEVAGKLLKEYHPKNGYKRVFDQEFTGFPKDVGFDNGLSSSTA